jgi:hypothetical protein
VTRLRLFLLCLLGAALWLVLIACIAVVVSLVGWLGFILGVGAFVAMALVFGSILREETDEDDPFGIPRWVSR